MIETTSEVHTYTGYLHSTDIGRLLPRMAIGQLFLNAGFTPDVIGVKIVSKDGKMKVVGASFAGTDCVLISIDVDRNNSELVSISVKGYHDGRYRGSFILDRSLDGEKLFHDLKFLETYILGV